MLLTKEEVLCMLFDPNRRRMIELPKLNCMKLGKIAYILQKNVVKNMADLSYDNYSPWNGKDKNGCERKSRTEKSKITLVEGLWCLEKNGDFVLKRLSCVHARELSLRREIWTVHSKEGDLFSDCLYCYYAENDIIMPESKNRTIRPSTATAVKTALDYRTTVSAKKLLMASGHNITTAQISSLSRRVPSHLKKKTGPKPTTNFGEITDRYVNRNSQEIEMLPPFIDKTKNGKVIMRSIVGYVNSFKHLNVCLSPLEEIATHREAVERLDVMPQNDADRYFETFLQSVSVSGSLPCATTLLIDTTFDLSNEYLTIACGYTEIFKNNKSKKNSTFILAYMIHTDKTQGTHKRFSEFLNDMLIKYAPDKVLGCIIHDGEDAFKVYSEGSYLRNAITLRCDVHRLANLKEHARDSSVTPGEAQKLFFGEKRRNSLGTTLTKGLLQSLTKQEFDKNYRDTLQRIDGKLRDWLIANKENLYSCNSMRMKLLAGHPVQYASTNVLEARNAEIKKFITRKEKSEVLMDTLLHIHRNEMKERLNAAISLPSSLECSDSLNNNIWLSTPTSGRKLFLSRYGLEGLSVPTKCDLLPSWVFEGYVSNFTTFLKYACSRKLHNSSIDSNLFFLISLDEKCVMLRKEGNRLICCKKRCYKKTEFCIHILVSLMEFETDELSLFLRNEEERRNKITTIQSMRRTTNTNDGSKTVRRGNMSSAGNHPRTFEFISSGMNEIPECGYTPYDRNHNYNHFEDECFLSFEDSENMTDWF